MSKIVNSVVLGLVSFVLILAVFWYVVEIRHDTEVAIPDATVKWGTVDGRNTEARVTLYVQNPHRTPIEVKAASYELIINGVRLAEGSREQNQTIAPQRNATYEFSVHFSTTWVRDWITNHFGASEQSHMQVRGAARVVVAQVETQVPYAWESRWGGLFLQGLENNLVNCPQQQGPCIDATKARWDVSGAQDAIALSFTVKNNAAGKMRVHSWTVDVNLSRIMVAKGGSSALHEIPPGGSANLQTPVVFQNVQLLQFWPEHVAHCEQSQTDVFIRFVLEEERQGAEGIEVAVSNVIWQFSAPTFDTRFLCGGS